MSDLQQLRAEVASELESMGAHGLDVADTAKRFAVETAALEWALWATDPHEDRGNFNQGYADRQLERRVPTWREARDDLLRVSSNLELPDHDQRMRAAQALAQWHLGGRGWGSMIVRAYLHPVETMENLRAERESKP